MPQSSIGQNFTNPLIQFLGISLIHFLISGEYQLRVADRMALEVKSFHGMSIALKRNPKGALAMNLVFLLIAGIVALGFCCIVLPYMLARYRRFRYRKILTCPETQGLVEVALESRRAFFTGIFGKPVVRAKSCSLWPRKKGCAEGCVKESWPSE